MASRSSSVLAERSTVQLTSVRTELDVVGALRDVDYVLGVKTADTQISARSLLGTLDDVHVAAFGRPFVFCVACMTVRTLSILGYFKSSVDV